jgi:hypothetical protein
MGLRGDKEAIPSVAQADDAPEASAGPPHDRAIPGLVADRASRASPDSSVARNALWRYSPAAILLAVLVADSNRLADPDLWGHIRFGQAAILQGHPTYHDPYSYSMPGAPWHDYEWLGEVVMAGVYNAAGVVGLKLWKFACTALTIFFIAETEAETDAPPSTQLLVLLVAALALVLQMQFRPQMFTFVLLGALLAMLTRDNYNRSPVRPWIMVPLMALWANLHGGWVVGIVVLAVYAGVATLCDLNAGEGWRRGVRLGAITVASAAATLMNPYGLGLWRAVAWALRAPYKRVAIQEWQPMLFAMTQQWHESHSGALLYLAVLALVAGLAVAFAMMPRGGDLPLVVVAAVMAVGAWLSVRNMALVAIAASGPLARHLKLIDERRRAGAPPPITRPVNGWVMLALCAFLIVKGGLLSSRLGAGGPYPAAALDFMSQHGLAGNVLSEWGWGDYLIWHGAPGIRVFVDGRDDTVYPITITRDYLRFHFDWPGADHVLDAYPHDFVLISADSAATRRLMQRRTDWKLLYSDKFSLLYGRANSPTAHLPGLPISGVTSLGTFP